MRTGWKRYNPPTLQSTSGIDMARSFSTKTGWAVVLGLAMVGVLAAQDDDEGPMSDLKFVVIREYSGKPVRNAAVILHPVTKKGKQSHGGLELKTDGEGRTNIDGIPYGPLRIQVLAPGFQTFGEDYQIDKAVTEIVVKLKRPGDQYSVYENHDAKKAGDPGKPDASKPPEQKP
jgi:hypothetical protein